MYKKEYDAEKNDKVAVGLIIFVFIVVIVFIACFPQQYKKYGLDGELLLSTMVVGLLVLVAGGYAYWLYKRTNKITKYIKLMKATGVRYPATITCVEEYEIYFRGSAYKTTYAVLAECDIDGKTYKLLSKPLCVNPMEKFATGKCSVYVRDNTYVISDFHYKSAEYGSSLNVKVRKIEVDEKVEIKTVDDFADFKIK